MLHTLAFCVTDYELLCLTSSTNDTDTFCITQCDLLCYSLWPSVLHFCVPNISYCRHWNLPYYRLCFGQSVLQTRTFCVIDSSLSSPSFSWSSPTLATKFFTVSHNTLQKNKKRLHTTFVLACSLYSSTSWTLDKIFTQNKSTTFSTIHNCSPQFTTLSFQTFHDWSIL